MKTSMIGLDLAKSVFQVHGVDGAGQVFVRKQLKRGQVEKFFAKLEPAVVGMEACGGAHHWGRVLQALGHEVRLMPAAYVKPYVKRNKTDGRDAEAICEAMQRPSMRFVAVKRPEQQAMMAVHRTRALLVRQRTMLANALRAIFAEFGVVAAVPDMKQFRSGRGFAAWLGLTPRQNNSAFTRRSGGISKQGQRDIRCLLILGASSHLRQEKVRKRMKAKTDPWLTGLLARRPVKVAAVAQAAKTARIIWALLAKDQCYRAPAQLQHAA